MSHFKCESGSVTVMLLVILPFLTAVLCVAVAVFMVLRTNTHALQQCRVGLLAIENERLGRMGQLLKMNPRARVLQRMRERAEQALKIAIESKNPTAITAATAYRLFVLSQQVAFATAQKSLITTTNLRTRTALAKLKIDVSDLHRNDARLYEGDLASLSKIRYEWSFLNVEPIEKDTITPQYKPVDDFEKRQTIQLAWDFHPAKLVPAWLGILRDRFNDVHVTSKCLSTAEQKSGGRQWRARLAADRSWSNLSSSLRF